MNTAAGRNVLFSFGLALTLSAESMAETGLAVSNSDPDILFAGEASAPNLQPVPLMRTFTTHDTVAPACLPGYPRIEMLAPTTARFLVKINENGRIYFVVLPDDAAAPSSEQVRAGTDGSGRPLATGFSGSSAALANTETTLSASRLSPFTAYDMYCVAEDSQSNLQNSPVKLDFATATANIPEISGVTSSTADGIYRADAVIDITITFSRNVRLTGGDLLVTLETGSVDRVIAIAPFDYSTTVSGTYIVQDGDWSEKLTVNELSLSAGATLTDAVGNEAILFIPTGSNLADLKTIVVDAVAPVIVDDSGLLVPVGGGTLRFSESLTVVTPPLDDEIHLRMKLELYPELPDINGLVILAGSWFGFVLSDTSFRFATPVEIRIALSDPLPKRTAVPIDEQRAFIYTYLNEPGGWYCRRDTRLEPEGYVSLQAAELDNYLLAVDTLPPIAALTVRDTIRRPLQPCTLSISLADNILNNRISIFYRMGGEHAYQNEAFILSSTDTTIRFVIPAAYVTSHGLDFQVAVDDGNNIDTLPAVDVAVMVPRLRMDDFLKFDQWQLFSIPLLPGKKDIASILFDNLGNCDPAGWRAFSWTGDAYAELDGNDTVNPGSAHWIRTRIERSIIDIDTALTIPTSRPFEIPLHPGWNAISIPYPFPVDWSTIRLATGADTINLMGVYAWGGESWLNPIDVNTIHPWHGYYVKNLSPETLSLRIPAIKSDLLPLTAGRRLHNKDWISRITVQSGSSQESNDYFGIRQGASNNPDAMDYLEPPASPARKGVYGYFPVRDKEARTSRYMSDIRAPGSDGQVWNYVVRGGSPGERVTLSFSDPATATPNNTLVYLYDITRGCAFNLIQDNMYTFIASEHETSREILLIVGDSTFISRITDGRMSLPKAFSLLPVTPNPARRTAAIRFEIPPIDGNADNGVDVFLALFDISGRCIKVLKSGKHDPGYYTAYWNGTDNRNSPVADGHYLCRIVIGNRFKKTRQVAVLR